MSQPIQTATEHHIAGPWEARLYQDTEYPSTDFYFEIYGEGLRLAVVEEVVTRPEGSNLDIPPAYLEANARLMAAAPDLLAALKLAVRAYENVRRDFPKAKLPSHPIWYVDANVAMAKAEGPEE